MRIFYDHQVTSLQDAGGVSRYFFQLGHALLQFSGVEPEYSLGLEHSTVPFRSLPPPAHVRALRTKLGPGYQRYAVNEALTALSAPFFGRFDVYHSTYQRILPWIRRRAVVVTHHDSTPARFPQLFPDAAAIQRRLDAIYARADRILCISEFSRNDLLTFHRVDHAKTEVIHHGFTPLPPPVKPAHAPTAGHPFLLYIGARAPYKNFPLVLQALARQRDKALRLLAVGGEAWQPTETQHIARLGLADRVSLLPRATDAELAWAYASARLFIYPSLYEGFGFPPLEAMSIGCPAVVSRTSALPEICGDAAFYFDPASVDDLAALITSLHQDEALLLSKRAIGHSQVLRYDWAKAAALTLAAYRAAMEGN